MDNSMVKVAVCSRRSSQEQAEEGTSLEYQKQQISSFCGYKGCEIFHQYSDPGYTGKDDNRPGIKQLLADAKQGLFTKVIIYKLDRLAQMQLEEGIYG